VKHNLYFSSKLAIEYWERGAASVGHQRVFIRGSNFKPPSAFQQMDKLPQVCKIILLRPCGKSECTRIDKQTTPKSFGVEYLLYPVYLHGNIIGMNILDNKCHTVECNDLRYQLTCDRILP
jgi:hypothetical protein